MQLPKDINEYSRGWAPALGDRILQTYPPLQGFDDVASPLTGQLVRKPFPAQTLAMMGVVKRWNEARGAAVIAECGTGKTLISLGAVHVHSDRRPYTALAMVPPQLVEKWAREAFLTLPRVRVFFIDGLRTPTSSLGHAGVNEVRLRHGRRRLHPTRRPAIPHHAAYERGPSGRPRHLHGRPSAGLLQPGSGLAGQR